jgi:hypothetical protein
MNIKKACIPGLCAVLMAGAGNAARIFLGVAPPSAVVEHPGPTAHPGWE